MIEPPISYQRQRFLPHIIALAVWRYFRFPLGLRLVEELLLERGIVVSYETVRVWAQKFGSDHARRLKRKKPSRRDVWHLDKIVQIHRHAQSRLKATVVGHLRHTCVNLTSPPDGQNSGKCHCRFLRRVSCIAN
jgi:transposase-like protein